MAEEIYYIALKNTQSKKYKKVASCNYMLPLLLEIIENLGAVNNLILELSEFNEMFSKVSRKRRNFGRMIVEL